MGQLIGAAVLAVVMAGAFALGFFCALKAVRMGLKWSMQTENGIKPTSEREDNEAIKAEAQRKPLITPDLLAELMTGQPTRPQKDDEE